MSDWHMEQYSEEQGPNGGKKFYRYRGGIPLSTKIKFWSLIVLGAAVGTVLFLFFVTVFVYVFLPVAALLILYSLIRRFLQR